MEHTIELLFTVFCAVVGSNGLWAFLSTIHKNKSAESQMMKGLGHSEIFRVSMKYIRRDGVTQNELEDLLTYLYAPYKEMGGNGTAETIVGKVKALPILTDLEAAQMDKEMCKYE